MKEYKETENNELGKASRKFEHSTKSQALRNSMSGDLPAKPKDIKWTPQDGTRYHSICQQTVLDQIEDVDNDIEVINNQSIIIKDKDGNPGVGIIDTLIEHKGNNTLIDYKTNDMNSWSISDAKRFGDEHGNQLERYVKSQNTLQGTKGYIIAIGRPSQSSEVLNTYVETVQTHDIGVLFPSGGEPEDVVASVRQAMKQTKEANSKSEKQT
jgi:hypothetical protein